MLPSQCVRKKKKLYLLFQVLREYMTLHEPTQVLIVFGGTNSSFKGGSGFADKLEGSI